MRYFVLFVTFSVSLLLLWCADSDVVVQIVDARNPLLFRCEDLEAYVHEVDARKTNVILINKSDFLTVSQRYLSRLLTYACRALGMCTRACRG